MKIVDARGLPCPQPVLLTRNALHEGGGVTTIVDNDTARQNVTRMAEKAGHTVTAEKRDDGVYLHIAGGAAPQEVEAVCAADSTPVAGPLVVVIPADVMGRGDAELGQILIRGFLHTLGEVEPLPDTIVFFNSGVRLTVHGSPVVEDLEGLCARGVEMLVCGTCLNHYDLKDRMAVGEVSNMYAIAETLLQAGKVVSL